MAGTTKRPFLSVTYCSRMTLATDLPRMNSSSFFVATFLQDLSSFRTLARSELAASKTSPFGEMDFSTHRSQSGTPVIPSTSAHRAGRSDSRSLTAALAYRTAIWFCTRASNSIGSRTAPAAARRPRMSVVSLTLPRSGGLSSRISSAWAVMPHSRTTSAFSRWGNRVKARLLPGSDWAYRANRERVSRYSRTVRV